MLGEPEPEPSVVSALVAALPEGIPAERPGPSGRDTIPAPSGGSLPRQHSGPNLHLQRQHSDGMVRSYGSSPPMHHPGMVAYHAPYGAAYPIYPFLGSERPAHQQQMERAASPPPMYPHGGASPPMVFPGGGSPPLPTGFMSVPILDRGSPVGHLPGGGSPPPFLSGGSPPLSGYLLPYGSSPPPGSPPPGMVAAVYHPVPYMQPPGPAPPEYAAMGVPAPGAYVQQQPALQHSELLQRMAGLGLQSLQTAGRSEGRASARIARSHRAGGAYNASDFVFSLEEAEGGRGRTTLMIRNIPNKYSQQQMVSVLRNAGFEGSFDFFYLPCDFRNKCNLGYAFVNFCTSRAGARLFREFHQKRWDEQSSRKICEVTFARVQGREALIEHFKGAKFPSDDADLQPLVYTQREGDVASAPMAIHAYIAVKEQEAAAAAAAAEAEEQQPNAQQPEQQQ